MSDTEETDEWCSGQEGDTLRLISCAQVDDCTEAEDDTLSKE